MMGNQPSLRPSLNPTCHEGSDSVLRANPTFRLVNPEGAFKDKSLHNLVVIKGTMGALPKSKLVPSVITTVQLQVAGVTRQICE